MDLLPIAIASLPSALDEPKAIASILFAFAPYPIATPLSNIATELTPIAIEFTPKAPPKSVVEPLFSPLFPVPWSPFPLFTCT